MAVTSTLVKSALNIKFKEGVDEAGKDIIKSKSYNSIKLTSTEDDLLLIGTALGSLMQYEFAGIVRSDEKVIVNE
jgi:hypothetical protein